MMPRANVLICSVANALSGVVAIAHPVLSLGNTHMCSLLNFSCLGELFEESKHKLLL